MKTQKNWFESWFNTPYYHILYKDRNDEEAQHFMRNLTRFLQLHKNDKVLDLPCGKGRHAVYLNSLGYDVIGADLSENSIAHAKQFENETLHFEVHDMRDTFKTKFDAILNLFTSFGYFDDDEMNIAVLKNLKNGLKKDGILVIDFLNVTSVAANLVAKEKVIKEDIDFKISRVITNDFIVKDIQFEAGEKEHHYTEYVRNINLDMFKYYLDQAGLTLKHIFGDYNLNDFNSDTSERLILLAK